MRCMPISICLILSLQVGAQSSSRVSEELSVKIWATGRKIYLKEIEYMDDDEIFFGDLAKGQRHEESIPTPDLKEINAFIEFKEELYRCSLYFDRKNEDVWARCFRNAGNQD